MDAGLFDRYVGGGLVSGALTGIPASQPVPSGTRSLTAAFVTRSLAGDSGKLGGAGVECLDTEVKHIQPEGSWGGKGASVSLGEANIPIPV